MPSRNEQVQYRLHFLPLQQHIKTVTQQYNSKFRFKLNILYASSRILLLIYLLTAIGVKPGGSSTVHIYTQTTHRPTQLTTLVGSYLRFEHRVIKLQLMIN
jgi:uncharacterized integral membrane protein